MRIRSIKPEFWKSESVAELSWDARLVWLGLWSYVDDNGVGRYNPKLILADLFPLEDDPGATLARVTGALDELSKRHRITVYDLDDRAYLFIEGWDEHQRIDRPSKARYPRPSEAPNARIQAPLSHQPLAENDLVAEPSRDTRETLAPGTGEQGNRGTGDQVKDVAAQKRGHRLPEDWTPTTLDIEWQRREGISDEAARRSTEKFCDHWRAAAGQGARKLDWSAAWKNWLRNDAERARPAAAAPAPVRTMW